METSRWTAAWATPMAEGSPMPRPFSGGFRDHTIRQVVSISAAGEAVRFVLTHPFGVGPAVFSGATVARASGDEAATSSEPIEVTFGGRREFEVGPGQRIVSDALPMTVAQGERLAISLHCMESASPGFGVRGAAPFIAEGSRIRETDGGAFRPVVTANSFTGPGAGYFLSAVEVHAPSSRAGALVAVGDSIVAGGWPEHLAHVVLPAAGIEVPVLNAGIAGNRVLTRAPAFGDAVRERLDRDVLSLAGATAVVVCAGINDIGFPHLAEAATGSPRLGDCRPIAIEELIDGHVDIVERTHAAGLRAFGTTLLPCKGALYWCEEMEAMRQTFNEWLRRASPYDAVIDFDEAVQDPSDPIALHADFDAGDHLHPNERGQQRLAGAVGLDLIRGWANPR